MNKAIFYLILVAALFACTQKQSSISKELIDDINLKRGEVISCSPGEQQFGKVEFDISCKGKAKEYFNSAMTMLHSFEYDEAEKAFAKVIDEEPSCAMAYWGVAMSNFHPIWGPATEPELQKGNKAIKLAQSISTKTKREADYINAVAAFYSDWQRLDHKTRCLKFEAAMKQVYTNYPNDNEAAVFYALAMTAAADLTDKTYAKQKEAGTILNTLYATQPNHPGIVHYIIHTYDSPELAELALPAARKYASIAPSSAHALHMPSHIFTRLGLWTECIKSNMQSVSSAKCYAEAAGIKGHWDEELHGLDYLMYAYLQKGDNVHAKQQLDYLNSINEVTPVNFKVAYAFAAIPSRYYIENKMWKEVANLKVHNANIKWEKYPWESAIIHFSRMLGSVNTGNLSVARTELNNLKSSYEKLQQQKEAFKANKVLIQIHAGDAWLLFKEGKNNEAITLMSKAADLEDKTGKHPVTPGDVVPARELLGDMLMQMNRPAEALTAYEASLQKTPKRLNGLRGAERSAAKSGDLSKAKFYSKQLILIDTAHQSPQHNPDLRSGA